MHIHSLKLLTLLSTLSFVSIAFPSAPPVLPFAKAQDELRAKSEVETQQAADSFEAKLAAIDAMADVDILCEPIPLSRDKTEQDLVHTKVYLANLKQQVPKFFGADVQWRRLAHKYWTTCKEIETCNNHGRKQQLSVKKQQFDERRQDANGLMIKEVNALLHEGGNSAVYAYNYRINQMSALANQLLLERIDAEKEKARLQQENQALKAQLRGLSITR